MAHALHPERRATMPLPVYALVARLLEAEDSLRRRCMRVALRLEIGAAAIILFEIASHADAALEDIAILVGDARPFRRAWLGVVSRWARALGHWVTELWPGTADDNYRAIVRALLEEIALVGSLRAQAASAGERRVAKWCALWIDQRQNVAQRLTATLDERALAIRADRSALEPLQARLR